MRYLMWGFTTPVMVMMVYYFSDFERSYVRARHAIPAHLINWPALFDAWLVARRETAGFEGGGGGHRNDFIRFHRRGGSNPLYQ